MFKILYDILPCRSLDMTSLWLFPSSTTCLRLVGGGGRSPAICVAWSVSCVRVLRVNKWEALEFVLVQVRYKLLIWGCQHWGVACEKTIKVLSIAPTLPWRGEQSREREMGREAGRGWNEFDEGCGEKKDNKQTTERKKRNTTKNMAPTNQITHSRDCGFPLVRMWASDISASSLVTTLTDTCCVFVRVVSNGRSWLGSGDERSLWNLPDRDLSLSLYDDI